MVRVIAASTCTLCVALFSPAPAAAYRVDSSTQSVAIDSLRDFEQCQKERGSTGSEACLEALRAYVKEHPKDAFDAGKHARHYYMHWVALDFFAQALSESSAAGTAEQPGKHRSSRLDATKKLCGDEDVAAAVLSGLALPARYPAVAQAQKMVSESCQGELDTVVAAHLKGAGSTFLSNACPLVPSKVRTAQCSAPLAAQEGAAPPAPPPEPSAADRLASAPKLRQAPPVRHDPPVSPAVHRLDEVFPAVPAGQLVEGQDSPLAQLKGLDWRLLNLDAERAEVLRGTHGEEVMLAPTKPGGQEFVLLKFKGVRSAWNERVVVAVERNHGAGKDYVAVLDDREVVVMIERQRQYQAFPKGVVGGLWLNPVRPGEQALKLPARRDIAGEFAAAQTVAP